MTDYFALLDEPRRPWLDPEAVKEKFLALSAQSHPDRAHHLSRAEQESAHQRYTDLNAAYQCLREPKDRLRHLLELERGAVPKEVQQTPAALVDWFLAVGQLCRETDALLAEKSATLSPLLRAQCFQRGLEQMEKLEVLRQKLEDRRGHLLEELKRLDAAWSGEHRSPSERAAVLDRLDQMYRLLSFDSRWSSQLQERILRLSL